MDLAGVREALHRQPFEPFVIQLADGRSLRVRHPDFVAVGKRRIVVLGEDDSSSFVEPLLIVSIDWPRPGSAKNGKRGPRK
ncbi:MAG: hypothetical protein HYX69_22320 [Planctomycetia bacterium]|nr:hypothetical protein [Planctomycetia bacterium]